jgi:N-acetylglucosamine-6-phosphate deacetylase
LGKIKIFTGDGFSSGRVSFGRRVERLGFDSAPAGENADLLIPGLVDIHSHGAMLSDFSDGEPEGIDSILSYYAGNGVTAALGTTMTYPKDQILRALIAMKPFVGCRRNGRARLLGVNMEGPFLSAGKRGAHLDEHLLAPSAEFFDEAWEASGEALRLISIAPELAGAEDFIAAVKERCRISAAHTESDYDIALHAFKSGVTQLTHTYNAMPPFSHRAPGPIGAAMDAGAWVELITDGIHIHPAVVRATFRMFPGRVCLISDSIRSAGMPDGDYESGGQPIRVSEGKAVLSDATIAGSNISLFEGMRRAVSYGIALHEAVAAATINPARAIGASDRHGRIAEGLPADLVLLTPDLNIKQVWIDGYEIST